MKLFSRLLLALAALLLLAAVALPWLAFESAPRVERNASISPDDVQHAHRLLKLHDPRRLVGMPQRTLSLSQHEAGLLLDQAVLRFSVPAAEVTLMPGVARVEASIEVPRSPFGRWLNVDAVLLETERLPVVDELRIGRVPVPRWLAAWALARFEERLGSGAEAPLARELVRHVSFGAASMQVAYEWRADTPRRVMSALVPPAEQARLQVYAERLADMAARLPDDAPVPLTALLAPMFELARERSAAGQDAAAENRAALTMLALYSVGRSAGSVVPAARQWRAPRYLLLTLRGREDFPQHVLVSAVLAAGGGGPLADAVGLYKETVDARSGSGFSFNDIAADRAGARLGQLAVAQPQVLQARLAAGVTEAELLPDVSDLPEFLSEREFRRRFGAIGAPAYNRVIADIEARLEALPLLR